MADWITDDLLKELFEPAPSQTCKQPHTPSKPPCKQPRKPSWQPHEEPVATREAAMQPFLDHTQRVFQESVNILLDLDFEYHAIVSALKKHRGDTQKAAHELLASESQIAQAKSNKQSHHEKLKRNLERRGLQMKQVPGDNNCQFHALCDVLNREFASEWTAEELRAFLCDWLEANGDMLMDEEGAPGCPTTLAEACLDEKETWPEYVHRMRKHNKEWGDEATLLAAAVAFGMAIEVISSLEQATSRIIHPPLRLGVKVTCTVYLGHYHEFHYTSTRELTEQKPPPPREQASALSELQYDEECAQMMNMEFDELASRKALHACEGNVENAIAMLLGTD